MKDSVIVDFDTEHIYAECLIGEMKGKILKIPRENVRPAEWIAKGEHIWCVEHNIWNFKKMFENTK